MTRQKRSPHARSLLMKSAAKKNAGTGFTARQECLLYKYERNEGFSQRRVPRNNENKRTCGTAGCHESRTRAYWIERRENGKSNTTNSLPAGSPDCIKIKRYALSRRDHHGGFFMAFAFCAGKERGPASPRPGQSGSRWRPGRCPAPAGAFPSRLPGHRTRRAAAAGYESR